MNSFAEFRASILKLKESRNHTVNNSYGVYDGYKYYRKTKPKESQFKLTESQYFAIIREMNTLLMEKLLKGEDILLPLKMGKLELRKFSTSAKIKDDKLVDNYPIDWDNTLKLWYEDEDAKDKKTLVKLVSKETFLLHYNKIYANYKNKTYYGFQFNQKLKKNIKNSIEDGVDAFKLNNYE